MKKVQVFGITPAVAGWQLSAYRVEKSVIQRKPDFSQNRFLSKVRFKSCILGNVRICTLGSCICNALSFFTPLFRSAYFSSICI